MQTCVRAVKGSQEGGYDDKYTEQDIARKRDRIIDIQTDTVVLGKDRKKRLDKRNIGQRVKNIKDENDGKFNYSSRGDKTTYLNVTIRKGVKALTKKVEKRRRRKKKERKIDRQIETKKTNK